MRVVVHARIHGLAGRAAELRELLAEHAATTAADAGNLSATAYQPLAADPGEFMLETWWEDDRSLRAHYASAGYQRYATRVGELLARPSDVQIHYVDHSVNARGDPSLDPTRQG